MTNHFLKFLAILSFLTLVVIATSLLMVQAGVYSPVYGNIVSWSVIFLTLIAPVVYHILIRAVFSRDNQTFMKRAFATNVVKILAGLIFLIWLINQFDDHKLGAVLIFMGSYFVYTILVLLFLFANLRPNSEGHKNAQSEDAT